MPVFLDGAGGGSGGGLGGMGGGDGGGDTGGGEGGGGGDGGNGGGGGDGGNGGNGGGGSGDGGGDAGGGGGGDGEGGGGLGGAAGPPNLTTRPSPFPSSDPSSGCDAETVTTPLSTATARPNPLNVVNPELVQSDGASCVCSFHFGLPPPVSTCRRNTSARPSSSPDPTAPSTAVSPSIAHVPADFAVPDVVYTPPGPSRTQVPVFGIEAGAADPSPVNAWVAC